MSCKIKLTLAVLCLAGAAAALMASAPQVEEAARVERGRYLVATIGCADCHSPKKPGGMEPDETLQLSGHRHDRAMPPGPALEGPWLVVTSGELTAWNGPWGTSFARNLTPDVETGIGSWSEAEFVATIRNGRTRGRGRELLPPMPWPIYANLTDEDLGAIFAYLRTIPAVSNRVPEPLPPPAAAK
jgi:mono/diheme cytochrome c family protein